MKPIEKLRESSHLDDDKWTLANGEVVVVHGAEPSDPDAVNWGEAWRSIADEIEAEIAEGYIELPKDGNGEALRIGDEVWFHDDEPGAEPHIVRGYGRTNDKNMDVFLNYRGEGWCPNTVTVPDVLVHRKPDPLKELLKELASDVRKEWLMKATLSDGVFDEYAERIRELTGGAE